MQGFRHFPSPGINDRLSHAHAAPAFELVHVNTKRQSATTGACSLYTSPATGQTLPVLEDVTLTWNPCVDMSSTTIDLYLSVQQTSGLTAVHLWQYVPYQNASLTTQLNPSWWNASSGAGQVTAQFSMVPSDQPVWNSPAPAGPSFTIAYNGTYPVVEAPVSTGPSVETVGKANARDTGGITGGKLAVAVAIPLLVVAILVGAYVAWSRLRKRPEKKRWSAVIDERVSMYSQGTWQPRASMASRPGSHHPRGSASIHSGHEGSIRAFAYEQNRPSSAYSATTPSPLGAGIRRPPPTAEMRQIGSGERVSRVSFRTADENPPRPSMTSSRRGNGPLKSSHLRKSTAGSDGLEDDFQSVRSSPPMSRSSTRENLAIVPSPSSPSRAPGSPGSTRLASSLRRQVEPHGHEDGASTTNSERPQSPFDDSAAIAMPRRPTLALQTTSDSSHMPTAFRNSLMSPDQALASYAAVGVGSNSVTPSGSRPVSLAAAEGQQPSSLTRTASTFLRAMPSRMLRTLSSSSNSAVAPRQRSGSATRTSTVPSMTPASRPTSPFDDPPSDFDDEKVDVDAEDVLPPDLHAFAMTTTEWDPVPVADYQDSSVVQTANMQADHRDQRRRSEDGPPAGTAL